MDDGKGRFKMIDDVEKLLPKEKVQFDSLDGVFKEGETLEIRGSRFRITSIKPNGRMKLKLMER